MITVSNVTVRYGGKPLFDEITCTIGIKHRIGLVGKNGAGKSTLLKLIAKQFSPDEGEIITPKDYRIGYLPQDGISVSGKTVYDEVATTVFAEVIALQEREEAISHELSSRTDYESDAYSQLIHDLTECHDEVHRKGGSTMRADIENILSGLGFRPGDTDRLCDEFSGGWQMRIELAKILLSKPDCILLDEPTNHLDIESVQWLEQFLSAYFGSVVLVSHDRAFLDTITNRTIEITNGGIEDYGVSYSKYIIERQERRALVEAAYKNQQRDIAQQERFIERFKSKASLASRVQSRIKQLDKIDRIELEEEDTSAIRFSFPPAPRSGKIVMETKNLSKSYGSKSVLKPLDVAIERGDRIAFVGKNGEGKTTFAKILNGKEEHGGELIEGHNVQIGYFEQHQAESLDPDASVFDIIDRAAKGEMRLKMRSLLGAFLFSGDSVNKKVRVLSGGEKSRLAMAKLLLEPSNLLILDEPTNHLDMRSKDVLKQALLDYEGTLVVVSHDREFLQGLTTKVWEFAGGRIKEYDGDIYEYLVAKNATTMREIERAKQVVVETPVAVKPVVNNSTSTADEAPKHLSRDEQKERERLERKKKRDIEIAELRIATLEAEIARMEEEMNSADFFTKPGYADVMQKHSTAQRDLEIALEQWSELAG